MKEAFKTHSNPKSISTNMELEYKSTEKDII